MKLPKGIRRTATGWRAYGRVNGQFFSKCFPPETMLSDLKTWRETERVKIRLGIRAVEPNAPPPGFRADAQTYKNAVRAMVSYSQQCKWIDEWVELFGDRPRSSITSVEIRAQRDRWLTVGPRAEWMKVDGTYRWVKVDRPLGASSVNHRLRALENLWTVLDGRHAPNPVREVPECDEPQLAIRAIPIPVVRAILKAMPDTPTRARLEVIAWTGIPHRSLMRIEEPDVDLQRRLVTVPGRRKGQGTARKTFPLTTDGVRAFRSFRRHDAWGPFSTSSLYRSFQRACDKLGLEGLRPYDLRHTFATELLAATNDRHATQRMLGLSTPALVDRYAAAAVDPALASAARKLQQKLRGGGNGKKTR